MKNDTENICFQKWKQKVGVNTITFVMVRIIKYCRFIVTSCDLKSSTPCYHAKNNKYFINCKKRVNSRFFMKKVKH